MKKLVMPEYGRHIQQMVDHCVLIKDEEERTRCAYAIVASMGNMYSHLRDVPDFRHKLWDHLAVMSDYKLKIDYPVEINHEDVLFAKPSRLSYPSSSITFRCYGKWLQNMIDVVDNYSEDEERMTLVAMIANRMKKHYLMWGIGNADDQKIFDDLRYLSKGKIDLDSTMVQLANPRINQGFYNKRKR